MSPIRILSAEVASKIAAGEVVERPVSVVKELVENALDSGATEVRVDLEEGGKKLIRVQDNGCGMSQEDAALCFRRHATSKILNELDLEKIATLGFRGEALASISAVSRVILKTSDGTGGKGYLLEREGDKLVRFTESNFPRGTLVEVRDLFFNLPARRKFLRSERSELSLVVHFLIQMALAFYKVKFALSHNQKEILNCPAVSSLRERVYQLYGKKVLENLMTLDYEELGLKLSGLASRPFSGRLDRQHQFYFVNRRPVKDRMLSMALTQAYLGLLEKQKNPEGFIFLEMPFDQVDVNVHPAKAEVRFREPQKIYRLILKGIEIAARQESLVKPIIVEREEDKGQEEIPPTPENIPSLFQGGIKFPDENRLPNLKNYQIAEEEPKSLSPEPGKPVSSSFRVLGQYLNSYIIAASEEALFIIDQHNAHERILFEKFQQMDRAKAWASRQMLFPRILELSPAQKVNFEELETELQEIGFRLEPMGGKSFALKEYPEVFKEEEADEILLSVLEEA
ncbi:MAG: DNA mismatch repair endonuclease MutL, partial [Candidatus Saccharicenans sp.]